MKPRGQLFYKHVKKGYLFSIFHLHRKNFANNIIKSKISLIHSLSYCQTGEFRESLSFCSYECLVPFFSEFRESCSSSFCSYECLVPFLSEFCESCSSSFCSYECLVPFLSEFRNFVLVVVVKSFPVYSLLYPHPLYRYGRGVYWNHSVRLFRCQSVHLFVCHPVDESDRVRATSPEPLNHLKKKNQTWYGGVLS